MSAIEGPKTQQAPPSFREDPLLDEVIQEFEESLKKGNPRLPIPGSYMNDVLGLPQNWGEADLQPRYLGKDRGREDIWEYDLFERGRERFVATIAPHTPRVDEMVRVSSLDQAEHFLQILSDRRFSSLAQAQQAEVAASGKHESVVVFQTARQARMARMAA